MLRFERTHRIPIIHNEPGQGVIALGPDQVAEMGRAMEIVARILKGAKPGDIPVDRVTRFRMTVNLSIAKAIGLEIPASILVRADEVIP